MYWCLVAQLFTDKPSSIKLPTRFRKIEKIEIDLARIIEGKKCWTL